MSSAEQKLWVLALLSVCSTALVPNVFDPRENIWVTLARSLNTTSFCASLATPDSPFVTCLIGVPLSNATFLTFTQSVAELRQQHNITRKLPFKWRDAPSVFVEYDIWDDVLPVGPEPQELALAGSLNATAWCNYTSVNISRSNNMPIALPAGLFLICGDRAWPGIPSHIKGGPCSIGRLTFLTPNTSMIYQHYRKMRSKRSTHKFEDNCDSTAESWNPTKIIAVSFLAPGVGVAQSLTTLNKLGCWLAKQTNATSKALSDLLLDVDSVRQDDPWHWFNSLFNGWGIGNWIKSILQMGLIIFILFIIILMYVPCISQCMQQMMERSMSAVFLSQGTKEKGGDVGNSSPGTASRKRALK